jgi:hypothetical protein
MMDSHPGLKGIQEKLPEETPEDIEMVKQLENCLEQAKQLLSLASELRTPLLAKRKRSS